MFERAVPMSATVVSPSRPKVVIRALELGEDATAFRTLNEEWIVRFFSLEARDLEILGDPENSILRKGGLVFMAYSDKLAIGCVALIPQGDGIYELSKMSVAPEFRGHGIGRKILQHAIAEARTLGASSLLLGSNTRLADAIHLYESVGFHHVPSAGRAPSPYDRANVFMRMEL